MNPFLFVANWISMSFLLTLILPLLYYTQTSDAFCLWLPVGIVTVNVAVEGAKNRYLERQECLGGRRPR